MAEPGGGPVRRGRPPCGSGRHGRRRETVAGVARGRSGSPHPWSRSPLHRRQPGDPPSTRRRGGRDRSPGAAAGGGGVRWGLVLSRPARRPLASPRRQSGRCRSSLRRAHMTSQAARVVRRCPDRRTVGVFVRNRSAISRAVPPDTTTELPEGACGFGHDDGPERVLVMPMPSISLVPRLHRETPPVIRHLGEPTPARLPVGIPGAPASGSDEADPFSGQCAVHADHVAATAPRPGRALGAKVAESAVSVLSGPGHGQHPSPARAEPTPARGRCIGAADGDGSARRG